MNEMSLSIERVDRENFIDSHFQGKLYAKYQELVAVFGEPEMPMQNDRAEWFVEIEGLPVTIYADWRADFSIVSQELHEWNIGGEGGEAVTAVADEITKFLDGY